MSHTLSLVEKRVLLYLHGRSSVTVKQALRETALLFCDVKADHVGAAFVALSRLDLVYVLPVGGELVLRACPLADDELPAGHQVASAHRWVPPAAVGAHVAAILVAGCASFRPMGAPEIAVSSLPSRPALVVLEATGHRQVRDPDGGLNFVACGDEGCEGPTLKTLAFGRSSADAAATALSLPAEPHALGGAAFDQGTPAQTVPLAALPSDHAGSPANPCTGPDCSAPSSIDRSSFATSAQEPVGTDQDAQADVFWAPTAALTAEATRAGGAATAHSAEGTQIESARTSPVPALGTAEGNGQPTGTSVADASMAFVVDQEPQSTAADLPPRAHKVIAAVGDSKVSAAVDGGTVRRRLQFVGSRLTEQSRLELLKLKEMTSRVAGVQIRSYSVGGDPVETRKRAAQSNAANLMAVFRDASVLGAPVRANWCTECDTRVAARRDRAGSAITFADVIVLMRPSEPAATTARIHIEPDADAPDLGILFHKPVSVRREG